MSTTITVAHEKLQQVFVTKTKILNNGELDAGRVVEQSDKANSLSLKL